MASAAAGSMVLSRCRAVALSGATMVMWPSLRFGWGSLPYQCTDVPSVCSRSRAVATSALETRSPLMQRSTTHHDRDEYNDGDDRKATTGSLAVLLDMTRHRRSHMHEVCLCLAVHAKR